MSILTVPALPVWFTALIVGIPLAVALLFIALNMKNKRGKQDYLIGAAVVFTGVLILSLLVGAFAKGFFYRNLVPEVEATWGINVDSRVGSDQLLNGDFTYLKNKVPYTGRLYVDEDGKAHLIEVDGMMEIQPVQPMKEVVSF